MSKLPKIFVVVSLLVFCLAGFSCRKNTPYLTIIGGVNMADGLGRQSMELIEAMKDSVFVNFIPTYVDRASGAPKSFSHLFQKKNKKLGTFVICQEPIKQSLRKLRGPFHPTQIRIAYSMLESTRIPEDWVQRLNQNFDLVAVPDRFLIDVYRESGVQIPIYEIPLGRNLHSFLESPLKQKKNRPFIFGCFGAGISRKNQIGLIRAFHKAFKGRTDVVLAIHCRIYGNPKFKDELQEAIAKADGCNIQLSENPLDSAAYLEFLKSIDCYVNPSKGEGFSIQPREAMALGIPTIVTDNTAQHTICESGLVRAVPCLAPEPAFYEWSCNPIGSFFPCSEDALAEALLDVERNYDIYLAKSSEARDWASRYDYEKLKPLYLTFLKPREVVLGTENQIVGDRLITNSKKLYHKYKNLADSCRTQSVDDRGRDRH